MADKRTLFGGVDHLSILAITKSTERICVSRIRNGANTSIGEDKVAYACMPTTPGYQAAPFGSQVADQWYRRTADPREVEHIVAIEDKRVAWGLF